MGTNTIDVKYAIAPRIGVSHPINEQTKIHYFFGRLYQMPALQYIYEYLGQPVDAANSIIGNPELD